MWRTGGALDMVNCGCIVSNRYEGFHCNAMTKTNQGAHELAQKQQIEPHFFLNT